MELGIIRCAYRPCLEPPEEVGRDEVLEHSSAPVRGAHLLLGGVCVPPNLYGHRELRLEHRQGAQFPGV